MNTNHLARQYDKLSAHERLALVMAAAARGDEVERTRLMDTAPRIALSAPHQFGLPEAFLTLSQLQFMELLDVAGAYLGAFAAARHCRKREAEAAWDEVLLLGYLFNVTWAGWRQFCAALQFEPETMWECYPGYRTIQGAARLAGPNPETGFPGAAFVEEGVARYFAEHAAPAADITRGEVCPPLTANRIAAGLQATWERVQKKWG